MEQVWFLAAIWLLLALAAVLLANLLHMSTALSEIVVGTVAQLIIGAMMGQEWLGAKAPWISFMAGTGAIVPTFLAGAELGPQIYFSSPRFIACAAAVCASGVPAPRLPEPPGNRCRGIKDALAMAVGTTALPITVATRCEYCASVMMWWLHGYSEAMPPIAARS